ncbi:MAG: hypothetical protein EU535_01605 [Promethearchaeota archaeon]|nr:MAG: hypothetical protein EU535_01605 [Candidatus Lokiarchaeota archaeon]
MNRKTFIFLIMFSIGFLLGLYLLFISGSYFLLIFSSFFGILLGYLFGNLARQSQELKRIESKTNNKLNHHHK